MREVVQPSTLPPGPPSALLRWEEGVLCEEHLKGICGVTQVDPGLLPAWIGAPYRDMFLHSAHTRMCLWLL